MPELLEKKALSVLVDARQRALSRVAFNYSGLLGLRLLVRPGVAEVKKEVLPRAVIALHLVDLNEGGDVKDEVHQDKLRLCARRQDTELDLLGPPFRKTHF